MAVQFSKSMVEAAWAGLLLGASALSGCASSTPVAAAPRATPQSESASAGAKACCRGKNDCKGQGGCKTDANACGGQNDCKGKGGCDGQCPKE